MHHTSNENTNNYTKLSNKAKNELQKVEHCTESNKVATQASIETTH